jgi:hypothetical protein
VTRAIADAALKLLSGKFQKLYSPLGRESIPPERPSGRSPRVSRRRRLNQQRRIEPIGTEQTILQPPDCQLAEVKLTCSLNTRTVTADP